MAHAGVVYVRPTLDGGQAVLFGVSGKLWRDALVMYDRQSRSLWSQVAGRAVAGPRAGERLRELPSQVTTWAAWKRRRPDTLVLVKPSLEESPYASYFANQNWIGFENWKADDERLPRKELVLGLELGAAVENEGGSGDRPGALAVPVASLEGSPLLEVTVAGVELLVVSPAGEITALAWNRRLGDRVLTFEATVVEAESGDAMGDATSDAMAPAGLALEDRETGSRWSWETGEALVGPLAGERLEPVDGNLVYWGIWSRFHPGSSILTGKADG